MENAERFFSQSEILAKELPAELRKQAFFDVGRVKRIISSARRGLSIRRDESMCVVQARSCLLRNHKDPGEVTRWSMPSVPCPFGRSVVLGTSGRDWN